MGSTQLTALVIREKNNSILIEKEQVVWMALPWTRRVVIGPHYMVVKN